MYDQCSYCFKMYHVNINTSYQNDTVYCCSAGWKRRGRWNSAGKHRAVTGATAPRPRGFWGKKLIYFVFFQWQMLLASGKRIREHGSRCIFEWFLGVFQVFCTFWGRMPPGQPCRPGGRGGHDSGRDSPPALLSLLPGPSFHGGCFGLG